MSLVLAEEVAEARSACSTRATLRSRPAASRAIPAPLIPPPMIRRSTLSPVAAFPAGLMSSPPLVPTSLRKLLTPASRIPAALVGRESGVQSLHEFRDFPERKAGFAHRQMVVVRSAVQEPFASDRRRGRRAGARERRASEAVAH